MGNPKVKWTSEEEDALKAGVTKHGSGRWKNILRDPEFALVLINRSNIDLKVCISHVLFSFSVRSFSVLHNMILYWKIRRLRIRFEVGNRALSSSVIGIVIINVFSCLSCYLLSLQLICSLEPSLISCYLLSLQLVCLLEPRVYRKHPLYLHKVGIRLCTHHPWQTPLVGLY